MIDMNKVPTDYNNMMVSGTNDQSGIYRTPQKRLADRPPLTISDMLNKTPSMGYGPGGTWDPMVGSSQAPSYNSAFDFSQLPMPSQWNTASDFYTQLLKLAGMPTSTSDWYQQAKQTAQYDIENAINNAREQAGLSGLRWSTPLGVTAQRIAGENMARLGTQFAQQEMAAEEAARARQMQAAGALGEMGQWLPQYGLQLAGQAAGLGNQLYGLDMNTINALYQQFLRQSPEGNPWLQYGLNLGTATGIPQTYTPGAGSQILSAVTSLLPLLFLL